MKIYKAYKTELKPNNKQITFFNKCSGASRYVYNWGLSEWQKEYEAGEKPSQYGLCVKFNSIKDEICPWIRELPYSVVESSLACLGAGFQNFFRRIKTGEKPGYPKFKNKYQSKSFRLRNTKVLDNKVRLTGIGWVRLKQKNYIPENGEYGLYATISERANKWYISIMVEEEFPDYTELTDNIVGVDLGIKTLAMTSDGEIFDTPKDYKKYDAKIKRLQRELSRRNKGGKNYQKTKKKLAKAHAKIADARGNAIHEMTTSIVNENPKAIVLEDLNVKGMVKNHKVARANSNSSYGEIRRQFEYKSARRGIEIQYANTFYPSSKTCSNCGNIKTDLTLKDRTYHCDVCGFEIDRDLNAAINLKNIYNKI